MLDEKLYKDFIEMCYKHKLDEYACELYDVFQWNLYRDENGKVRTSDSDILTDISKLYEELYNETN